jgi:hypothetical protein
VKESERLAAYLKKRDAPCPGCGRNLRGVASDRCPSCDETLTVLKVIYRAPRASWAGFAFGAAGLLAGMAVMGAVWPRIMTMTIFVRGHPPAMDEVRFFIMLGATLGLVMLAVKWINWSDEMRCALRGSAGPGPRRVGVRCRRYGWSGGSWAGGDRAEESTMRWMILLLMLATGSAAWARDGVRWVDASTLEIEGRGFEDAERFRRLPERFREQIPQRVWELSGNSAGLMVRFSTDATEVRARWTTGPLLMNNLSPLAVRGLDLYTLGDDGWSYLGTARPKVWGTGAEHEYPVVTGLSEVASGGLREMALYLPLYESVGRIELGVPEGAVLGRPRAHGFVGPPVVVYGTSITQGASASRPGLAFTAILGRMLGREVVNLGFSATGRLDPGMVGVLAGIDAAVYVLDCQPNLRADEIEERTVAFVTALQEARPDTPIVLVDNIIYPGTADRPGLKNTLDEKRAALRRAIERLGPGTVTLVAIEGDEMAGEDESADGIHPTDEGMRRHAVRLREAVAPLLERTP